MSDLRKLRLKIDEIDKDVVKLLLKRLDLSRQIGEYKLRENKDILDIQREKTKLDTLSLMGNSDFEKYSILEIYQKIMDISKEYQYKLYCTDD